MYYLNNRYYHPLLARFITPDSYEYIDINNNKSFNLYAYCYNDPIKYADPEGNISISTLIIGALIGAAIGFGAVAYVDSKDGEMFNGEVRWYDYAGASILGGLLGVAAVYLFGASVPLTIPTYSFMNTGGALALGITGSSTITISGAQVLTGVGLTGLLYMLSKQSKSSGKETSSDKPSWVNTSMVDPSQTAQQNATRMLNEKYGLNNWIKGQRSEFSQIVKWIIRWLKKYGKL